MITDGKYVLLFNIFDLSGHLTGQQKMGEFSVSNGSVSSADGMCKNQLPLGPVSAQTEWRITYGMNTGYFEVRHEQSFRPKPLNKSETPTITKGPYAKLLRAFESHLAAGMRNVVVDRDYWMPGLAGSNLDGTKTYIDSRLPEYFNGVQTDKYLLIHEVTEKWLMDKLGFDYGYAHNIALASEKYAVEADGLSWDEYEKHMWDFIHAHCMPDMVPKEKRPPSLDPDRITHTRTIKDIMRHTLRKSLRKSSIGRVASVAVVNPDTQEILMGKRHDNQLWTMPGGHLNPDETPENGAKRELFEETGITAKKLHFLGTRTVKKNGKPLKIYSFLMGEAPTDITTEQDPDEEVQEWQWKSKHTVKHLDQEKQLHVPIEGNVTLSLMGFQSQESLQKADKISESGQEDKKTKSWYDEMHDKLHRGYSFMQPDKSISSEDLGRFLDQAIHRHDDHAASTALTHPNAIAPHFRKFIDNVQHLHNVTHSTIHNVLTSGKLDNDSVNQLLNIEAAKDKFGVSMHPMNSYSISEMLSRNPHLSPDALNDVWNQVEHKQWSRLNTQANRAHGHLAKNPNASPEMLDEMHQKYGNKANVLHGIMYNPNTSEDTLQKLTQHKSPHVQRAAKVSLKQKGVDVKPEHNVQVAFGTNKARQIRDWVNAHGGEMHAKDLKAAGMDVDQLGMSHLKGPKGTIKAEAIQDHINKQPRHDYEVSEDAYGYDPNEDDYSDPLNPRSEMYQDVADNLTSDQRAEADYETQFPEDAVSHYDEQRHSGDQSKVMKLNMTPEHIKQLKDAGVWNTVQKITNSSVKSTHPVAPIHGIGWVRYTEKPDGIFIDEIQSDLGESLVKKVKAITTKRLAAGTMTADDAQKTIADAEQQVPEEHHEKIKQILFGGKHADEVLHEAFHEHMRNADKVGTPIHVWQPHTKANISLAGGSTKPEYHPDAFKASGNIPAHMQRAYGQTPKKMGYTPAQYGDISTERTPRLKGFDTLKTTLRKSEPAPQKVGDRHSDGNHIGKEHPFERLPGSQKKKIVWDATPEYAAKVDNHIAQMTPGFIEKQEPEHRPLVQAFVDRVTKSPTRHIRQGMDNDKWAIRARHIRGLMLGDQNYDIKVHSPDKLTFTIFERHGGKGRISNVWNFNRMDGATHI